MPAAYPLELRRRIVKHYGETTSTQEETSKTFNIGITTLRVYLRLDERGQLSPKVYVRGRQPVICGKKLEQVKVWVEEKPGIMLGNVPKVLMRSKCLLA